MAALRSLIFILGIYSASAVTAPVKRLNDGKFMPIIALGTGRGTAKDKSVEEVRNAVLWAIEAGYRHIDTAAIYDDEVQVGQGIADAIAKELVSREDLFVTTKLWNDKHHEDQVIPALRESLTKLGLTYVDLYLMHFPLAQMADGSPQDIDYLETWNGMEKAHRIGMVKSIGVSNFNESQLIRLIAHSNVRPAVNQIEVNPTLTQDKLVTICHKQGVHVMAYSPFGFLVDRKNDKSPPPRYDDPTLVNIAKKYNKTTSQVVLRYLIDRDLIPIPKSTNKQRIAENIDIFDFQLTNDEVRTISAFNQNIRVIEPKAWKDHPYYPFGSE